MCLNNRVIALGGGLALVAGLLAIPTAAQDSKVRTKPAAPSRTAEPVDAQDTKVRTKPAPPVRGTEPVKAVHPAGVHVPDHFNQLEPPLTNEQRERIYEIQARALRESEAVLTPAQRSSLQEHRSKASAPARDERPPANEPTRTTRKKGA